MYRGAIILIGLVVGLVFMCGCWPLTEKCTWGRWCAPCWGKDNKIFYISKTTYGRKSSGSTLLHALLVWGEYFADYSDVYICSMNCDGTDDKRIVKIGDTRNNTYWLPMYLDYCPANDLLLVSGDYIPGRGEWYDGIWIISPDGKYMKKISNRGRHASWSPDGKRIVYQLTECKCDELNSRSCNNTIWVMDADGSNNHMIYKKSEGEEEEGCWNEKCPMWSPKGDLIAFVSNDWIWIMKPDGSEKRKVVKNRHLHDWLPDGEGVVSDYVYGLNGEEKELIGCGRYSLDGKWRISTDFVVRNTKTGEKIYPPDNTEPFVHKRGPRGQTSKTELT